MKNWEDLTLLEKTIIGCSIVAIAIFAPEIAMLVQFGGMEVAFAFLLLTFKPAICWLQQLYSKLKNACNIAILSFQNSASNKPSVFSLQASFCCLALFVTGSTAFAMFFFMPSMLLNGVLI